MIKLISKIREKRGDVTVLILVLGVFAIVALALLSFASSALKSKESISGFEFVEEANSRVDEYFFYNQVGVPRNQIIDMLELERDSEGLYVNIRGEVRGKKISIIYYLD